MEGYLPPTQEATQKYLRTMMNRTKNYLNWKNVIVIKVPHIKGLTVKDIIEFSETQVDVHSYLSDFEYDKAPNREWLWNIVNTLIQSEFKDYIDQKVFERKVSIFKSQILCIMIKSEFVEIFKNSQSVSFIKGKSNFLIRMLRKTKYKLKMSISKLKMRKINLKSKNLKIWFLNWMLKFKIWNNRIEAEENADK